MPAPSTPTSFAIDSRARPWFQGLSGGLANYDATRLTWAHSGAWIRLQIQQGGVWYDLSQGMQTAGFSCRSLTSTSAEIVGITSAVAFRVAAGNSDGQSAWSSTLTLTQSSAVPVLADLTAETATLTTNSTSALTLSWTDAQNHESYFELELRAVVSGAVRIYSLPTFVRTFTRAPGADGVLATTAYVARVRAVSEQGATRINGAWSNELVFTTLAPVMVLTQLPATVDWWRNAPSGSYTIVTNTPATSYSTGSLPTGLTRTSGVITGIATAAVNTYAVNITADNGTTSDTKVLTFNVREPALALRFALPGDTQVDAVAANAMELGTGAIGALKEIAVYGVVTGPVSSAFTSLTITGNPAWLAVVGTSLKGTPTIPGTWDVNVTGTNDTGQTSTEVIRFTVPALAFTSATSATVYEQEAVGFTVSTSPAAGEIVMSGAPEWLTLSAAGVLTGIAPEPGEIALTFTATRGGSSAVQSFTLNVQSVIDAPAEIIGHVGDPIIDAATYLGANTVEAWHVSGIPAGVAYASLAIEGENPALSITGTPAEFGIFEAVISAQLRSAADVRMVRRSVIFRISGGLFFYWFHDNPGRRELQVFLRNGEVRSLAETAAATLTLKRGDARRLHVIFRDGPFGPGRIGRDVVTADFTELRMTVRPAGDFDGEPYIDIGGAIVTETIAEKPIAYFDLAGTTDAIEVVFDSLNSSPSANPAAAAIVGTGELTWIRNGVTESSGYFTVAIAQDAAR